MSFQGPATPGTRLGSVLGIPVSVSPWYLALLVWFVASPGDTTAGLVWGVAVTVSLLIHEFGHALVARHFGLQPSVLLHGWGGLCSHLIPDTDAKSAAVTAAGPLAGLLAWAVVLIVASASGPIYGYGGYFVHSMLYVNGVWSLVNLAPIIPLDGGQLFRLGLRRRLSPRRAEAVSLAVSLPLLGAAVVWAAVTGSIFLVLLAGLLAWSNVTALLPHSPTLRRLLGRRDEQDGPQDPPPPDDRRPPRDDGRWG